MIVRIATEGQYELDDAERSALNELDGSAVAACEAGDETAFHAAFEKLLALVRERGRKLPEEEIVSSDVILPPPDVSLAEAAADFSGDGLIPG